MWAVSAFTFSLVSPLGARVLMRDKSKIAMGFVFLKISNYYNN
jgi:hypothetical protein